MYINHKTNDVGSIVESKKKKSNKEENEKNLYEFV